MKGNCFPMKCHYLQIKQLLKGIWIFVPTVWLADKKSRMYKKAIKQIVILQFLYFTTNVWLLDSFKSDCKHYAICLISMFISLLVFVALRKCSLLSILCCVVHNMPDFGFDCWRKKKERTQNKAQKTTTVIKIHFLLNMKIALSRTQYIHNNGQHLPS